MGTDYVLFAVDPDSAYTADLLDAAGDELRVLNATFHRASQLYLEMVSERPILDGLEVELNRRDGRLGPLLHDMAKGGLERASFDYDEIIRGHGGHSLFPSTVSYRPPDEVKAMSIALDAVAITDLTFELVATAYDQRRPLTEGEYDIFRGIFEGLLTIYRQSAEHGFGIVCTVN